jgi:hypothetical protein
MGDVKIDGLFLNVAALLIDPSSINKSEVCPAFGH